MHADVEGSLINHGFDQVIVALHRGAGLPLATAASRKPPNSVVQSFLDKVPKGASAKAAYGKEAPAFTYFPRLGVCVGYVDRKGVEALEADQVNVRRVLHLDRLELIRPIREALRKIRGRFTWGLRLLGVERIWDRGPTGKGVRVGHLDTGVDASHPALKGRIKGFLEFDFLGNRVPGSKPHDTDDHGTHTAGTICGGMADGLAIGVAPKVELYSGLVIEGGMTTLRVLNGMEWCLENDIRILSMSLGFPGYTPFFETVMENLRAAGVLPVMAIGNEGPGTSRSPGNYPSALSVGAVDRNRRVAYFSSSITFSRQEDPIQPNLVAPGVDVISARPGGGLQAMSGTSMAAPHVAGVAALLFQAKPGSTSDEVEQAILGTCDKLRKDPPERWGAGLINPSGAVERLLR